MVTKMKKDKGKRNKEIKNGTEYKIKLAGTFHAVKVMSTGEGIDNPEKMFIPLEEVCYVLRCRAKGIKKALKECFGEKYKFIVVQANKRKYPCLSFPDLGLLIAFVAYQYADPDALRIIAAIGMGDDPQDNIPCRMRSPESLN